MRSSWAMSADDQDGSRCHTHERHLLNQVPATSSIEAPAHSSDPQQRRQSNGASPTPRPRTRTPGLDEPETFDPFHLLPVPLVADVQELRPVPPMTCPRRHSGGWSAMTPRDSRASISSDPSPPASASTSWLCSPSRGDRRWTPSGVRDRCRGSRGVLNGPN